MNTVDIIIKKRDGLELTDSEIGFITDGYTKGEIPDYQVAALLMAIRLKGMSDHEIFALTKAMMESGRIMDLSSIDGFKVDKHSTGGVGDKITLIVCPIAAAAGVKIAKMSGRGLGFTGGTVDKLAAIPGYRTGLSISEFFDRVNENGISIISQTEDIAPADRLLYALRDVTGTVDSMALIASSIMSKKLALGADGIILDVKYGDGALMTEYDDARALAEKMKEIGEYFGRKMEYVLSPMKEPLGRQVGNTCEVIEAIEFLKGRSEEDLKEQAFDLAGRMIFMGGLSKDLKEGVEKAVSVVEDGSALQAFRRLIESQGGNPDVTEDYSLMPGHKYSIDIKGSDLGIREDTVLDTVKAHIVGEASNLAGAGRKVKTDVPDSGAGISVNCKGGAVVNSDTVVFSVFGNNLQKVKDAGEKLKSACVFKHIN